VIAVVAAAAVVAMENVPVALPAVFVAVYWQK
jgi:hypothetical protein